MLTLGHVTKCVMCEHVFIFVIWTTTTWTVSIQQLSSLSGIFIIVSDHLLFFSAQRLTNCHMLQILCSEKYSHSFTHMIHQVIQFQRTLNVVCLTELWFRQISRYFLVWWNIWSLCPLTAEVFVSLGS